MCIMRLCDVFNNDELKYYMLVFFFFKQKTAYEMLRSLVGSEMCIRDRYEAQLVEGGGRNSTGALMLRQSPTGPWKTVCSNNFKKDQRLWYAACSMAGFPPSTVGGRKPHYTFRGATTLSTPYSASSSITLSSACTTALSVETPDDNTILGSCVDFDSSVSCSNIQDVVLDCDPPPTATQSASLLATVSLSPHTPSSTIPSTHTTTPSVSKSPKTLCGGLPLLLLGLSLIHISEPTRLLSISYAVFCLKKKKTNI
eukprot:TRINITY_DN20448_c0_g1_i6.p1 TRINITY_DN20448_c0_g1~~TRINITY_DN20448_c0_g1_i6.p1  ORF type:complete len:255 (-),score=53.72 TRINITY_DN20448_c0_g1_i6:62-826(-)